MYLLRWRSKAYGLLGKGVLDLCYKKIGDLNYNIVMPRGAADIIDILKNNGFKAYIVGGCVRDSLLNLLPKDWDITTSAKPEEIKKIFKKTIDTGIEHGTVSVIMKDGIYEVTTFRLDGEYKDSRRPESVTYIDEVEEDLRRRDFTINSMAYSNEEGVIDLFGGINDLICGKIRCVGEADERFKEDALRMLRAIRFGSRFNFEIDENTYESIKKNSLLMSKVSKERVFDELNKIILSDNPQKIFLCRDTGIDLYIYDGLPEIIEELKNDDNSLGNIVKLENEKNIRWAAFLYKKDDNEARQFLKSMKSDNICINEVRALLKYNKKTIEADKVFIKKLLNALGEKLFGKLLELKKYGFQNNGENLNKINLLYKEIIDEKEAYNLGMLDINGKDIINSGIGEGAKVGEILNYLLDIVIKDNSKNKKSVLLEYVNVFFLQ